MESNLSPEYKTILEEIGKQLQARKSALLKRTLLMTWPYLLLVVCGYIFNMNYDFKSLPFNEQMLWGGIGLGWVIFAIIYSAIVGFIFEIEKQIWIDSYFDKRNMTLQQSWAAAKKLFWPGFKLRLRIFWQYYLLPIGGALVALFLVACGAFVTFKNPDAQGLILLLCFIASLLFFIGLFIYGYYIKIKLRYSWFLFLDMYGNSYSFGTLVKEMLRLNNVSKSDAFKKSLIANIGSDSVRGIANLAIGTISYGMAQFGGQVGKMLGGLTRVYGEEANRQATDLANITAQYILYRFACKELYGKEQTINEEIYRSSH